MPTIVQDNSLFEIDRELDFVLDEIQEQAESEDTEEVSPELKQRFQQFCEAHCEKVDRIGHFLSLMQARGAYCRGQANRLTERARSAENKVASDMVHAQLVRWVIGLLRCYRYACRSRGRWIDIAQTNEARARG